LADIVVSMKKKGQTQGAIQRFFTKLTDDTTESEGLSKEKSEDRTSKQAAEDQGSPNPSSPGQRKHDVGKAR